MRDILHYVNREIEVFAQKYYGSPILNELISKIPLFEAWLLRREQHIKDYYRTIKREEKISLSYSSPNFKIRLTFKNDGSFNVHLEHSYSHDATFNDKHIKELYIRDPGYVYFIESEFGWKIGKTRDLQKRNRIFEVKLPFKFAIRYYIHSRNISRLERHYHDYFKDNNINGEWFLITEDDIKKAVAIDNELHLKKAKFNDVIQFERKYLELINITNNA